jgi:NAD+ diphosphatase
MALDRVTVERHDPAWIAEQLASPAARAVLGGSDGVLVEPRSAALLRVAPGAERLSAGSPILLGLEAGKPLFAIDLDGLDPVAAEALAGGGSVVGLRDAAATLTRPEAGLAAYLLALLHWHRRHRFCANCGFATGVTEAGGSRHCPHCGTVHFPRTDPVVIMLVESKDRLLLGRRSGWPPGRYSVLAGFVSPGESAEEAVVREVREESGIRAYGPRFVASQPWPFPSSLMLGFEASADGGEPRSTDGELEEVHWFSRDHVRDAALAATGRLALPPPISIARFLIDGWLRRGAPEA